MQCSDEDVSTILTNIWNLIKWLFVRIIIYIVLTISQVNETYPLWHLIHQTYKTIVFTYVDCRNIFIAISVGTICSFRDVRCVCMSKQISNVTNQSHTDYHRVNQTVTGLRKLISTRDVAIHQIDISMEIFLKNIFGCTLQGVAGRMECASSKLLRYFHSDPRSCRLLNFQFFNR